MEELVIEDKAAADDFWTSTHPEQVEY